VALVMRLSEVHPELGLRPARRRSAFSKPSCIKAGAGSSAVLAIVVNGRFQLRGGLGRPSSNADEGAPWVPTSPNAPSALMGAVAPGMALAFGLRPSTPLKECPSASL
jgi:hypothetical protein